MPIFIDATHLRGHITGLEWITMELFASQALAPLPVLQLRAAGTADMINGQQLRLPLALARDRSSILICPGFPPAVTLFPLRERVIPYIHDTFLITRWADLNIRAKLYMAFPFRIAVANYPMFFVNSQTTRSALREVCRSDAKIMLYRPKVRNTFGVGPSGGTKQRPNARTLKLVAIGTIEPRKNYRAAANIVQALRERGVDASITIAGRKGWGEDWAYLESAPGVKLLGYATSETLRKALDDADIFISTSHDEGLGLPLLEAQHAGLPIVAPEKPVFREVLSESGIMIDPAHPALAADRIMAFVESPNWREEAARSAESNLSRWNKASSEDRQSIIGYLSQRVGIA